MDIVNFRRPGKSMCVHPSFHFLNVKDWDNDSVFMKHRQHHPNGNQQMAYHMSLFFHMPNKSV